MLMFDIYFCSPGDVPAMAEIEDISQVSPWPPSAIMADLRKLENVTGYLGAFYRKELRGFIAVERWRKSLWIMELSVHPKWRRMGAGSQLLCGSYVLGEEWGCRLVELTVRLSNREALAFYKRHGFRVSRALERYYRNGEHGIRMVRRSLSAPHMG